VIEPIPMGDAAKDYLSRYVSPTLLTGLTELCKKKPMDPYVSVSFHIKVLKKKIWYSVKDSVTLIYSFILTL